MSQRASLAILVVGGALLAAGIFAATACSASSSGVCSPSGFALSSLSLSLLFGGTLIILVGLILYVASLWGTVPPPSVIRANIQGFQGRCLQCGGPLGWVGPIGRWRCSQCGTYW